MIVVCKSDRYNHFAARNAPLIHSAIMAKPTKKKTAGGAVYRILDPPAVARLIERAVRARYDGNRTLAARRCEIDPATLVRLSQQKQPTIRHGTYVRMAQHLLEPDEIAALDAALRSPLAYELGGVNYHWETMYASDLGYGPNTPAWEMGARALVLTGIDPLAIGDRARERWAEYRKRDRSDMWDRLEPICQEQFNAFGKFAIARGHFGMRILVAENRVLAPLLEQSQSGFIERSWREMSNAELIRFVRDGLARERILLRRPALHDRAAAAARRAEGTPAPFSRGRTK